MWKMLQQKKADDYVIATGKNYTIKKFINLVAEQLDIKLTNLVKKAIKNKYGNL